MPTYVKTDYVPDYRKWYLTPGKEYLIIEDQKEGGILLSDDGDKIFTAYKFSRHLDGASWTVINRP